MLEDVRYSTIVFVMREYILFRYLSICMPQCVVAGGYPMDTEY